MAQRAAESGIESRTWAGSQDQTLARFEALADEPDRDTAEARRESNALIRRSVKAWRRGDITRAGKFALRATETDDTNPKAFHMLALALEKMGHRHKALVTFEHAYRLDPSDPELLLNLGLTAWALKMTEGAAGLFRQFIARSPDSPLGYNNLGSILYEMGNAEGAIETLRAAIYRMPGEAILWNSLATVLAEDGRCEESLVFYQEAIRLDPRFSRPWHNLGYAYMHLGRLEEARCAYDEARARAVDESDIRECHHSRSICLIGMGRLEEGWEQYEIRNDPRFRTYIHHLIEAPVWKGEPLAGKRLLVVGEQGLGDEFMFASMLGDLQEALSPDGKLMIAVEKRLVPLFQRSFPRAEVGEYDDRVLQHPDGPRELRLVPWATKQAKPDFYAPMATPLQFVRRRIDDFPRQPFLVPDPVRVDEFRARLEAAGAGPYVGICWRSMKLDSKRHKYYSVLDEWGPILRTQGVRFVNVQYGDCEEELRRAEARHGVTITNFADLDLKNDIDGAAALSAALDLMISAPTAAAAVAAAVGTETWFLTAGRVWPQLGTDHYPWYRAAPVFSPEKFADWGALLPEVGNSLGIFARKACAA
ncbi:MAG: tetratricopeptide repeat protein [Alphaproteobacteria bacterium]|nr:tetratricopeptide repeat protein [Alphaproteobacteria bacterium]MDE2073409.1 tetratricopeptide repeat protein [Alphaproteobacteria bacterium]